MEEERYAAKRNGTHARFALCEGVAALVAAALVVAVSFVTDGTVYLVLQYACSLVSLFIGFAGLGAGFYYLAYGKAKDARLSVWIAGGATFLTQLAAAIVGTLPYAGAESYDFNGALIAQLTSAVLNVLLTLALHFAILFFAWLLFFRGKRPDWPVRFFFPRDPLTRANLLTAAVILIYQLIGQIGKTMAFLDTYWPNIYPNERAMLIFEYVFLLMSILLGYTIAHMTQLFCFLAYTGEESD